MLALTGHRDSAPMLWLHGPWAPPSHLHIEANSLANFRAPSHESRTLAVGGQTEVRARSATPDVSGQGVPLSLGARNGSL